MSRTALWAVLPGNIDDPAAPSGGNTYDRRVLTGLGTGRVVHEIRAGGLWPYPSVDDLTRLEHRLAGVPDGSVVLLDGLVACAAPEIVSRSAHRLRTVVLVHLPLGDEPGAAPELHDRERRALKAAARIVATSEGAARRIEQLHDFPDRSVYVAPPGVDHAPAATPSPAGNRLLCVAAVTPRKAQDVLVEALLTLDGLDFSCTFVGACAGDYAQRVRSRADNRMHFAGTRHGPALEESYAAADLLVLPSRAETYGMVVTEALARAVPVLGTRVEGVPEAIGSAPDGGVPGALVPPGDANALAAALRRWLTDPGLREQWRSAARGRRGTLRGWDETTRRLSEVLDV